MRRKVISTLLVISSGMLLAQSAPIKMGLWETTVATAGGIGGAGSMKIRSCFTESSWKDLIASTGKPRPGCTTNITKTASAYNVEVTCAMSAGSSMVTKGTTTIHDSEHIVGETHTTMTMHGQTHESASHSTGHFVSASCGEVKPGHPEIEMK